jgi:thiamine biosynthesis lipoprotein
VELGEHPIDLGGIGKGYAVRRMSALLTSAGLVDHVVEAGGDCACAGRASDGHPWMVGVEDPSGGNEPVAVLKLTGLACATSSTRTRRWAVAGRPVHHLIDASTGLPGGTGLDTVTVVHEDPVKAEIWSKSLLLAGRRGALALAERRRLAAVIIQSDGRLERSSAAERHMEWVRRVA